MEPAKKEAILDAAVGVFTRHGFKKGSVDEIAQAAGVAKGTVYLAYPSKEELFFEAVQRELQAFGSEQQAKLDRSEPAEQQLQQASVEALRFMEAHPLVLDLFLGLYHTQLPTWAERFETLRGFGRSRVMTLLRLGVEQGALRDDLDLDEVATVLLDMQVAVYIWMRRAGVHSGQVAVGRRLKMGHTLALEGLRAPAKPKGR
jgi:AcrR family transcriptional regulator